MESLQGEMDLFRERQDMKIPRLSLPCDGRTFACVYRNETAATRMAGVLMN
jgi:hypothetical protein